MRMQDRVWMAAILDTRGKIRFTNGEARKTNQLVLQVHTQRKEIIERLCALTGSSVQKREAHVIEADRRPCTAHCTNAHSHVVTEVPETAMWAISGVGAAIVLENLIPYITVTTGLQAIVDNILAGLPTAGRGRSAVDQTIIRLKKLGWRIPPAALEHFVGTPVVRAASTGRFVKADSPEVVDLVMAVTAKNQSEAPCSKKS